MKALLSSFLAVLVITTIHAAAFAGDERRSISVSGSAEAVLDAHYAIVDVDSTNLGSAVSESYDASVSTIKKVFSSLNDAGISSDDIKKSSIYQGVTYTYAGNSRVVDKYYASVYIKIKVKDISVLNKVYRALAAYNGVKINGTRFKRSDEEQQRRALLNKAILNAREKAGEMAKTLEVELGKVIRISENHVSDYDGPERMSYVAMKAAESGPTESDDFGGNYGRVTLRAGVQADFEIR